MTRTLIHCDGDGELNRMEGAMEHLNGYSEEDIFSPTAVTARAAEAEAENRRLDQLIKEGKICEACGRPFGSARPREANGLCTECNR